MGVRIYPIAKKTELSFWNKALGLDVTEDALAKHEAKMTGLNYGEWQAEIEKNADCYEVYCRKLYGFGKGYDGLAQLVQKEGYMGSVRDNQTPKKAEEIIARFVDHCRFVLDMNVDVDDLKDIQWG